MLEFVNALFCDDLGPDYEPLRPHRPQVGPTPAVEFLWAIPQPAAEHEGATGARADALAAVSDSRQGDMSPSERTRRREADWIARRIRAMLDVGEKIVWDNESARQARPAVRAVRPGDIAVLFRALTNVEYYEEALRRYDIPYYLVGGQAFYAQQEIYDLLNLLRAIDSPCDEVSLVGVLRSPMFGLLDESLLWLAGHPEGLAGGLFAAELPDGLAPPQRRRGRMPRPRSARCGP